MKRNLLLTFSLLALAVAAKSAFASYDWNGIYFGGNIGAAWDRRDATIVKSSTLATLTTARTNSNGIAGGGQVGDNFIFDESWLAGVEFDISGANLGNSVIGSPGYGKRDNTADIFGTARARAGFAWDNWLLYGTGGFAWVDEDLTRTQLVGTINNAPPGTSESDRELGTGWTAGAGVEWGFAPHFTVRIEYLHLGISSKSFNFPLAQQQIEVAPGFDVVRFGINFKFR